MKKATKAFDKIQYPQPNLKTPLEKQEEHFTTC